MRSFKHKKKLIIITIILLSLTLFAIYMTFGQEDFAVLSDIATTISPDSQQYQGYVICLSDDLYQRALKNINFPGLKKFDAIKGSDIDPNSVDLTIRAKRSIYYDKVRDTHADLGSIGGVGCYMSHVALWSKIVKEKLKGLFIFESDAVCPPDFSKYMSDFLKKDNPHVLFFGICGRFGLSSKQISKIKGRFYCTHSYFITYDGAKLLLKYAKPIEQQIDSYMSDLNILSNDTENKLKMEPLNLYVVNENSCVQINPEGTSIQTKGVK